MFFHIVLDISKKILVVYGQRRYTLNRYSNQGGCMSKNLVIVLNDEEYKKIHKLAAEKGISASKFAYDKLFPEEDSFEKKWNKLVENLNSYPAGANFDISTVVGLDTWKTYDRGTKLALARTLKRKIDDGTLKNVTVAGRSSSNVTIYTKN